MKRPIYIFGAGGLGREILALVRSLDDWEAKGFFDDSPTIERIVKGIPVVGGIALARQMDNVDMVIAIGDPVIKQDIANQLSKNASFPVLVHPSAILLDHSSIHLGSGTIVSAGAVLTSDIVVGEHVLINLNATIGHDSYIGSYSSIMPGVNVAGEVKVGDCVLLGSGCNIRNRVQIAARSRVGMGAVVIKDVLQGQTVVGIPAQPMKSY